jgi:copper transport protein
VRRRGFATALALAAATVLALAAGEDAWAHAGLVSSEPKAGAELGAAPDAVRLSFSEQPEASLSEIRVLDADGIARQSGRPAAVGGDPLALSVAVPRLGRGVYTVTYRVVSAVDGHATAGTFAFGVRAAPTGVVATATTAQPDTSTLEVFARWVLLLGLVALLGAAVAAVAWFGGSRGTDLTLAAGGWLAAVAGLLLLAVAQRDTAGSSIAELLDTSVGEALIWRAVAIAAAGLALLVAWRRPQVRRPAFAAAALGALAAVAVHVGAGHAAAGGWSTALTVTTQVAHFAAAGVWFGGLAALLLGIRGEPSAEKAAAVRRFAAFAAAALVVVLVTGTVRAVDELSSWGELFDTGYGRAVLAKLALIALIAGLAARNQRRSVPAASGDLGPLRRSSRAELALAVTALAVAALLGTLAPAVSGQPEAATPGLSVSGADFATTVEVRLATASDEPGPNRFVAELSDYDSGEPLEADRVSLRFTPLDDPGVPPSTLALKPDGDGSYAASGANLTFDGRWGVTVLIERGSDAVEVPLELDLPIPEPFLSVARIPGQAPEYTMQVENGLIRVSPDPELPGPSEVYVTFYGLADIQAPTEQVVVTGAAGDAPAEQKPVTRLSRSRFVADVDLEAGTYTIGVVARTIDGRRVRGSVELDVPAE